MDTLFSLGSTYMFAQLVEHLDAQPQLYAHKKGYKQIFNEIIEAIDWCHRDGACCFAAVYRCVQLSGTTVLALVINASPVFSPRLTLRKRWS